PISTVFPSTTLFRSFCEGVLHPSPQAVGFFAHGAVSHCANVVATGEHFRLGAALALMVQVESSTLLRRQRFNLASEGNHPLHSSDRKSTRLNSSHVK